MAPVFDALQSSVFDTTLAIMGYEATWTKPNGDTVTGMMHFKDASQDQRVIRGFEMTQSAYTAEWKHGDFEGLFEAVQSNLTEERITINGATFLGQFAQSLFDGKTYICRLVPYNE